MTVSRVLNGATQGFSEETRQRVLEAVRELEYVPVAQPMIHNRHIETRILGLVFDGTPFEGSWGLPTFLGLRQAAIRHNYDLLTLLQTKPDWMLGQEEFQFLDRRSDGLIFITPINRYQTLQSLAEHQVPAVVCFTNDAPESVPAVVLDDYGAMRQAVQHLTAHGHERILHLTLSLPRSDFRERRRGFDETMKVARLKPLVMSMNDDAEGDIAADVAAALLQKIRRHRITAIACSCDKLAYWVQDIALANGLKIPHDLSLTGMDDQVESIKRGLTSIHFSSEEVGRQALETVVQMIQGKHPPLKSVLPVELVKRASVTKPVAAK